MVEALQELQEPIVAVLAWIVTGLIRWIRPSFWETLDTERMRLVLVAVVSTLIAIAGGVAQGLGVWPIVQLAIAALSGSVLLRRLTREDSGKSDLVRAYQLDKDRGVRTKL